MGSDNNYDNPFIPDVSARKIFGYIGKVGKNLMGTPPDHDLRPNEMAPLQRAYYEANKYMGTETSKIPFIGEPLAALNEAINCSTLAENLSPSVAPVVCQATKEVRGKK